MNCEELKDMYELYALGVLDGVEKDEVDEHLGRDCPACTLALRKAIGFNAVLATMVEDREPPARLRKRVLASVGVESKSWGWIAAWALLAAGLAVVFFVRGNQYREQTAKFQQVVDLLNAPETEQVLFKGGRVFVNPQRGVALIASSLPPAPGGKIYEMWLIPKGHAPVPAGLFQSGADGAALYVFSQPVERASTAAIAVSLEPAGGSSAPSTTPVIVATL